MDLRPARAARRSQGVLLTHQNVLAYTRWHVPYYQLTHEELLRAKRNVRPRVVRAASGPGRTAFLMPQGSPSMPPWRSRTAASPRHAHRTALTALRGDLANTQYWGRGSSDSAFL